MRCLTITVLGTPAADWVPRGPLAGWRDAVRREALRAIRAWEQKCEPAREWVPLGEPLDLWVALYFAHPPEHLRDGELLPDVPTWHSSAPTLEDLLPPILDSLAQGGAWTKGARVAHLTASKCYGTTPGAVITVRPINGTP